ncbi:MAG: urease accessory protein UreF [Burkholderiaceae bacterium]|nr:urease accessory protein UreF [Burkholderiaceae bacterium]
MWLASPALPIGGFSYSEGLESAVEWAGANCEAAVAGWLSDQLHLSLARGDLPVLAQAIAAWRAGDIGQALALNDWVLATRESQELRLQTGQMGKSLCDWLHGRWRDHDALAPARRALAQRQPSYPVAFALAAAHTRAAPRACLLAFAFAWAENMVQAAIKAVPLGQTAGQRVLARLVAEIPEAADAALTLPESERQAFTPGLAILSARHEAQYTRLFRS